MTDDVVTLERLGRQHADQFLGAVSASANQIGVWLGDQAAPKTSADVDAFIEDWHTSLGLVRLELVVEPANVASRRVAEKLGAIEEGLLRNRLTINGEVRNALMFGLLPDKPRTSHG